MTGVNFDSCVYLVASTQRRQGAGASVIINADDGRMVLHVKLAASIPPQI